MKGRGTFIYCALTGLRRANGPTPRPALRSGLGFLMQALQACGRSGGTQPPRAQRPRRSRGSEEETDRRNRVTTEGTKDTENEKKHPGAEEAAGEPRRGVLNSPGRRPKDKPGVSGLRSSPQSRLCLQAPAGRLGLTAGFNRGDRQDRRDKAETSWGRRRSSDKKRHQRRGRERGVGPRRSPQTDGSLTHGCSRSRGTRGPGRGPKDKPGASGRHSSPESCLCPQA